MRHRYGRRAPCHKKALLFSRFKRPEAIPVYPAVNYLPKVDWTPTMDGNDVAGDCVAVWVANMIRLISTVLGGKLVSATLDEVYAFYKTQNPGFDPNSKTHGPGSKYDNGMDMQLACEELVKNGIKIGGVVYKALGFVKIDVANAAERKAATSVFGSLGYGVMVADAQQMQFSQGKPWDYVANSPIEGGHAILCGGHMDVSTNDDQAACWAKRFGLTDKFISKQLEEAWGVIWPWHLNSKEFISTMDVSQFAKAFEDITGNPFPVQVNPPSPAPTPTPSPAPAPAPAPSPSVDPADAALASAFATWKTAKHL